MTDKIIIKTEYWNGDKLVSQNSGAFTSDDKTLVQISKLAKETLDNNLANTITEYLTK